MVVLEYAKSGYFNMEWHHTECFWTNRARKYYYRGRKRINILLKLDQFTFKYVNDHDGALAAYVAARVHACNLQWGTAAALAKAGIPPPPAGAAPPPLPPAPHRADGGAGPDGDDNDGDGKLPQDDSPLPPPTKRRKTTKKTGR
eukprot:gnl/Spiro4/4369_TR2168_c0_g1_i1.p2 gnl/Spiro4/4369_TR2168_c0_g1~~gnl/Spiro4/4369_TR2168_c0_g1_i1.p2  ORF type:complete len:144 (-),score=24.99 gnl/Spiro4/4369_TR2168_c0_g1_i1:15-446(-)